MGYSLTDLRTKISANHGDITGKNSVIDMLVNFVLDDLADRARWPDLQVVNTECQLATDEYYMTLPTLQYVDFVWLQDSNDDWYEVDIKDIDSYRHMSDGTGVPALQTDSEGIPDYALRVGQKLYFNRPADRTLDVFIDGYIPPPDLSTGADVPAITGSEPILISYGTGLLYVHRKQPEAAKPWLDLADYFINSRLKGLASNIKPTTKSKERPSMGI